MIDGRFKSVQDRFWDHFGRWVARTGVTANQVTVVGTAMMVINCIAYVLHRNALLFGIVIAVLEMSDNLDGAVARVTGTQSSFGAYLDAATDRYKESLIFLAIGIVTGAWILAFLCITGSLLTSYNKARAGMETKISNSDWPDLFERFERMATLCTGLILSPLLNPELIFGHSLLIVTLVVIACLTHITAIQRFFRARKILVQNGDE